jgi:hypothetical protein
MRSQLLSIAALLSLPLGAAAQEQQVPIQFQGKWAGSLQTCSSPGDGRLEIGPNTIRFYESRGKILAVRVLDPQRIELDLELTGEGETWRESRKLALSTDRRILTDVTPTNPQHHAARVRCS